MGINYSQLVTQLGAYLETLVVDANSATPFENTDYNNALPEVIADAEQRIYREVDFLSTRLENATLTATATARNFTIPAEIIIMQGLSIITPSGATPATGARNRLLRTTPDGIDMFYPNQSSVGTPVYYAMLNNAIAILAPTPDAPYAIEVTGNQRPAPMSSTNTTTYLATNFPDMFFAACMTQGFAFNRDFASAEGQQNIQNWEAIYQNRKQSAMDEELRRKGLKPEAG